MDIKLFEQLAKNAHYNSKNTDIINSFSEKIKDAFLMNNEENIRNQLSNIQYLPNELDVVHILAHDS